MKYLLILLLSLAMAGCDRYAPLDSGGPADSADAGIPVRITLNGAGENYMTRSVLTGDDIETRIKDLTLAAYDANGLLYDLIYCEPKSLIVKANLCEGDAYIVYVLANMGDMRASFPVQKADVPAICYRVPSYDEVNRRGIPMCGESTIVAGEPDNSISLDRLFAKVTVTLLHSGLDDYEEGKVWTPNMCNKSLYIRQANGRLMPFASKKSMAANSGDMMMLSDYIADLDDEGAYEGKLESSQLGPGPGYFQDTTLVFYVPENVQGRLLPENEDPFAKVYDNINGKYGKAYGDICTYLEFNAYKADTYGYSGSVRYRYYLGADNTSDFSVERNCRYEMTLDFSEEGFFMDNWKITRGDDWVDTRSLYFLEDEYVVCPGRSVDVMVHYHPHDSFGNSSPDPDRWSYSVDDEVLNEAGVSVSFDPANLVNGDFCLRVNASADTPAGFSFPITVMTKYGTKSDMTVVSVEEEKKLVMEWESKPEYVSQYGLFTVGGYDEDDLPLSVSVEDEAKVSCIRLHDNKFRVVVIGEGGSMVTVINSDGSKSVSAYVDGLVPELALEKKKVVLNPDGQTLTVGYSYKTKDGAVLKNTDDDAFASILEPIVKCDGFFGTAVKTDALELYVKSLTYGGGKLVIGGTYSFWIGAKACGGVDDVMLNAEIANPFGGMETYDFGDVHDYTLFSLSDSYTGLADEFADEIAAGRELTYPGPVPEADPIYVDVELVPRWLSGYSGSNGVYSASRDGVTGDITIRQAEITPYTSHSCGLHDVILSFRNRYSSEKISRSCGTLDIYVHTAIGARAEFGERECGYSPSYGGPTFAEVYNSVAGSQVFGSPYSSEYIYYMDVKMEWMTPVDGVYVFQMASVPDHTYDGLDFLLPSVEDGTLTDNMLFSVCNDMWGERFDVGGEFSGPRAGVGRVLYRALYSRTFFTQMPDNTVGGYFFGDYAPLPNSIYTPAYRIPDSGRFVGGVYYFVPSICSGYHSDGSLGYHVIHFLESIYPETNGWINRIGQ